MTSNLRDQFMFADCGHIVVVDDDPSLRQMVSIDVQVLRLRRKLEIDPSAPRVIQTERSVRYMFALPVEPL